ncbi:vitamin B12 ABC transporter ATP-binding protein BtuD [Citrobacter sp. JGM124]|uniref:vitamin B12 ABC transporter ATP-binding protein BtuD n=1 Tax=Citrobacter sp. JGM124 TaxID=2799789 RepID=UPI001BAB8760|nr:vitamin B12 ABC transporter ATP-binding protein BtuD [Citrobacter sp. JGM124]MBS0847505.1 vitamin B12 ABC transporter ATP-binding protein BtuD [Citrobacter sp. JGM124]
MAILQLCHVAVAGRLEPVSVEVHAGEITHLVGPNGAGKSTLLARMAGLSDGPGEVLLNERPLSEWLAAELSHHRAWLTQYQTPPFAMPVWHYLQLHQSSPGADEVMIRLGKALHLTHKLTKPVNQLSGGEWQRVRLAAVFMQIDPHINARGQLLLLDEPMNSLDIAQQTAVDRLLHYFREAGIGIVMSSHDLNHSLGHADQVWLLRNGVMLAKGRSTDVLSPRYLDEAYNMSFRVLSVEGHTMLVHSA